MSIGYEARAEIVCGPSLKAVLDRDWDQIGQREEALELVVQVLQAVEAWVQTLEQEEVELAQPALETAKLVKEQDIQFDENRKKPRAHRLILKGVVDQCHRHKVATQLFLELLRVLLSAIWSRRWLSMSSWAFRPPIKTRGLPSSNGTRRLCT